MQAKLRDTGSWELASRIFDICRATLKTESLTVYNLNFNTVSPPDQLIPTSLNLLTERFCAWTCLPFKLFSQQFRRRSDTSEATLQLNFTAPLLSQPREAVVRYRPGVSGAADTINVVQQVFVLDTLLFCAPLCAFQFFF